MISSHRRRAAALTAWDNAVAATRSYDPCDTRSYSRTLELLDYTWHAAELPLPWYPAMVARGISEQRTIA